MTRQPQAPSKPTWQAIHRHMLARPGQRFVASQLAELFKQRAPVVRPILQQLLNRGTIRTGVDGKNRVYYVPGPADLSDRSSLQHHNTGPLKGYDKTLFSHARLAMLSRT